MLDMTAVNSKAHQAIQLACCIACHWPCSKSRLKASSIGMLPTANHACICIAPTLFNCLMKINPSEPTKQEITTSSRPGQ